MWKILFLLLTASGYSIEVPFPWVVYYNDQAFTEDLISYNPIILDGNLHPAIDPLLQLKKEVLGYVDMTEVSESEAWFADVKKRGLIIEENPNWPGSWTVDIRNEFWKKLLLRRIIPAVLSQRFTGIMLDQIDVAIALEPRYKGMTQAAIDLILAIRKKFPDIRIMLNRGYEILPQVGMAIDEWLIESLYTFYRFDEQQYTIRPTSEYQWQLEQLHAAKIRFPHLILFSLDYWNPSDRKTIEKIYSIEIKEGLRPYVSTITLDEIVPAP